MVTSSVFFVGGLGDSKRKSMRDVCEAYRITAPHHHVHYFQYNGQPDRSRVSYGEAASTAPELRAAVRQGSGPLCLVGHSWGGDTVLDIAFVERARPIALVVSLDPVASFTVQICMPRHVDLWFNVRVDVTRRGRGNEIAALGGHYGPRPWAARDIDLGDRVTHSQVGEMFKEVEDDVRKFETLASTFSGRRYICGD